MRFLYICKNCIKCFQNDSIQTSASISQLRILMLLKKNLCFFSCWISKPMTPIWGQLFPPSPATRFHLDAFRRLCGGTPGRLLPHALGEHPPKLGFRCLRATWSGMKLTNRYK